MRIGPNTLEHQEAAETPEVAEPKTAANPAVELRERLLEAGTLAAQLDVDLDAFMRAAWTAYMEARPGLREHLEDLQLVAEIEALRTAGRIAQS